MRASDFYAGRGFPFSTLDMVMDPKKDEFVSFVIREASKIDEQCVLASINDMVGRGVNVIDLLKGMGKDYILLRQAQEGLSYDEVEALSDLRGKIIGLLRYMPLDPVLVGFAKLGRETLIRGNIPVEMRALTPDLSFMVDAFAPEEPEDLEDLEEPETLEFSDFGFAPPKDDGEVSAPDLVREMANPLGIDESEVKKIMSEDRCSCGCQDPEVEASSAGEMPAEIAKLLEMLGIDPSTIESPEDVEDSVKDRIGQALEKLSPLMGLLAGVEVANFNVCFGVRIPDDKRVLRVSVDFE